MKGVPSGRRVAGAGFCPIPGQVPYMEPKTNKLVFCKPGQKKACPRGFSCQFSPATKKNICCGKAGSSAGGNSIASKISALGSGGASSVSNAEICDVGAPYLVNGLPQTCTAAVCTSNFKCVFSRRAKNYYCCSKDGLGKAVGRGRPLAT